MRVRLGRWQGAMGRDKLVYNWRQLVSLGDVQAFSDEERQRQVTDLLHSLDIDHYLVRFSNLSGLRGWRHG
jgi:hypothetical protein